VVWGLRGNFLDVPTDCPQRDERIGWTGDLAVFAPTAAFLYDVDAFLRDWLADLVAEQAAADGKVPIVVPDLLKRSSEENLLLQVLSDSAVWGDASVWVPWALWQAYGDRTVLEAQYPSMTTHVRRIAANLGSTGLWDQSFQLADWLDPDAPPDQPWAAKADMFQVATACLVRDAQTVAAAATVLGQTEDAEEFRSLADRTRQAFTDHYVAEDGTIKGEAPTSYALAIAFGVLDARLTQLAGDRLAQLVADNGFHISTGFAGTPYICDALTATGYVDHAYGLLLERTCPSWLYPVAMGATTIWERWDSMLPDGSINPGEMTSFNHYAFGAVADWIHRTVGGVAPGAPGYSRVVIAPRPGGGITWANTTLDTPHGRVAVRWTIEAQDLMLDIDLPVGVEGHLDLEGAGPVRVTGSSQHRHPLPARS
jgi:alpha-L-rhamnosidase